MNANRLELNAVRWAAPHVEVTLGGARRRSPACPGPSGEPEAGSVCSPLFGWRTQFRLNGDSVGGHLVFEVKSGSSVLGTSIVPLDAVFREEVFQRALPLLHSGRSRAPAGGDPELLVTIRCLPKEAHASAEDAARRALADQLRLSCSQLRVTLRSLRLYGAAVNAAALRPYVKVAVGLQSGATMAALSSTERDAEEFVFVNPDDRRFDCGSLLGGRYEAPPRNEPRGSKTVPAYQRRAGNDVQVSYRNVRFVFWQFQQDQLDLDVYDEHPLFIDRRIALASLELDDLLLLPFQDDNGTAPLPSLPGKAARTTGLVTAPLHADGAADDDQIGEMQLEVEFLQDPLALPSPLEAGLLLSRPALLRSSHRLYDAALAAVAATAPDAALAEGPLGDARLLPLGVREALAALVVAAALSGVRASARHEDDAAEKHT
ncbi:unnamed protein product [Prorocentrum cordatum]|uniref:Uncharacterized protein n=1 Tax=Prorocentrum cordatum TaxID=2364126 RepID=A0ABN9QYV2_9DINO|nr:unnamed protein product [Polarella glacialis]